MTDWLGYQRGLGEAQRLGDYAYQGLQTLNQLAFTHGEDLRRKHRGRLDGLAGDAAQDRPGLPALAQSLPELAEYLVDAAQRWVLYWDVLRQRGDNYIAHEEAGSPPVLRFDYEVVLDGRTFERPCNYALVRILPTGYPAPEPHRRPYVIVDPRAGHGPGIGGSKSESQVGVALREGHPVYFVIFFPQPEPGQTLSDVCHAEARFVRHVRALHPDAPRPIIVGNCQGGWASMLLAASNPDLTGPLVLAGAPLSYWSGETGRNPMRYYGGLCGGALPALIASDLGAGKFDGANLVLNFEGLNPGRNWWRKYYDLYAKIDSEAPRFLDFEKWWGGFFFMNEAEIMWILNELFIGNRLARGWSHLDAKKHLDLRHVRSPIIVFASSGDNITPPQQALNWIADAYSDVHEIKVKGQRIIYLLHEDVGHLGIFVSSKVAKKEHAEISSTMKTIEALAPGLYEMVITDVEGSGLEARYTVEFHERQIEDILGYDDGRSDEELFCAISRLSKLSQEHYDLTLRPWVRAAATPALAEAQVRSHPLRLRRYLPSSRNPAMQPLGPLAETVRQNRRPAAPNNPFVQMERLWADAVEQGWNVFRDWRDAAIEMAFFGFYGSPPMRAAGAHEVQRMREAARVDLRDMPEVQVALSRLDDGGFVEGLIRMLILLAGSRGSVRRSRLDRSNSVLTSVRPLSQLSPEARGRIIQEQALIVDFEPERGLEALPNLLQTREERERALSLARYIAGPEEEMNEGTRAMFDRFKTVLAVSEIPEAQLDDAQAGRAAE